MTVDAADPGRGDPWGISAAALQRSVKAITVRAAENSVREAVSEASGEVWAGRAREGESNSVVSIPAGFSSS